MTQVPPRLRSRSPSSRRMGLTVDDLVAAAGREPVCADRRVPTVAEYLPVVAARLPAADPTYLQLVLDRSLVELIGDRPLDQVTVEDLLRRRRRGRAPSPATARRQRRPGQPRELRGRRPGGLHAGAQGRARRRQPGPTRRQATTPPQPSARPHRTPSSTTCGPPSPRRRRTPSSTCSCSDSTSSPVLGGSERSTCGSGTSTTTGRRSGCARSSAPNESSPSAAPSSTSIASLARARGATKPDDSALRTRPRSARIVGGDQRPHLRPDLHPGAGGRALVTTDAPHRPRPAPHGHHRRRASRRVTRWPPGLRRPPARLGHRHLHQGDIHEVAAAVAAPHRRASSARPMTEEAAWAAWSSAKVARVYRPVTPPERRHARRRQLRRVRPRSYGRR